MESLKSLHTEVNFTTLGGKIFTLTITWGRAFAQNYLSYNTAICVNVNFFYMWCFFDVSLINCLRF